MANCKACGAVLKPGDRFCGHCGADQYASVQQPTYAAPAPAPAPGTAPGTAPGPAPGPAPAASHQHGTITRAAMGLGIAGGLLGILWGTLAPYLTLKWPARIQWYPFVLGAGTPYGTGIRWQILLVIGLVLSLLGIVGAVVAPKARGVAAVLLIICGLVGFLLGYSWVLPGVLLLTAGGLAVAGDRE